MEEPLNRTTGMLFNVFSASVWFIVGVIEFRQGSTLFGAWFTIAVLLHIHITIMWYYDEAGIVLGDDWKTPLRKV